MNIAEEYLHKESDITDTIKIIIRAINKGYIAFDFHDYNNPNNFYVGYPHLLLELATGKKWTVEKKSADYEPKKGEYIVEKWVNGNYGHFARTKKGFNSLQNSNCVRNGKIESLRVFREID